MLPPNISIEEADSSQASNVALLLNFPIRKYGRGATILVAVDNKTNRSVGAAVIWQLPRKSLCWIRVVKGYRRVGIGRVLLSKIESTARDLKSPMLAAAKPFRDANQPFLLNEGFIASRIMTEYRLTYENAKETVLPVYNAMAKGGKIPCGAEIIDFRQVNERGLAQSVAEVLSSNMGSQIRDVLARVKGQAKAFDLATSFAVLLDGKPIAAMTTRYCDVSKVWIFPSFVVNSDKRTGWASVWLRYHWGVTIEGRNMVADVTFAVREEHRDTLKFAARTNAVVEGGIFYFSKRIG
jgi:GNAT superfamily N-acetyltransferase